MPIDQRKSDWFFVIILWAFAFTSLLSDSIGALGIPITADSANPLVAGNYWYGHGTDPLFLAHPPWLRIMTFVSAFVFGPFYAVAGWAFLKGRAWIRIPSLMYTSAMLYSMTLWLGMELTGDYPVENWPKWLAFNGPYFVVPVVLAWRMRAADPFVKKA